MAWFWRSGWALVLLAASGCTLMFSGNEHQGGVTAPGVEIQPAEPGTLDDLEAVITAESEAPGDAPVTYEYAWFLGDETDPRATGATLPSNMTEKGQVWTVAVTPTSMDRVGQPGEASVTIVNTPPKVISVGLSNYRPVTEDVLIAYPVVRDPDGDEVTVSFEWVRNGSTPVAAVTSDTIDLGERGFAQGDTVEVNVTASDAEGGETGTGGPVPVAQAIAGWRPLMPDRFQTSNTGNAMVLDEDHHRLVLMADDQLWELPLDDPRRYVRLVPQGEPPDTFRRARGTAIAEPGTGLLFVLGASGEVYRLDTERGAEQWTRLTDPDATIGSIDHASAFVDRNRDRLVLYDRGELRTHQLSGGAWSDPITPEPGPEVMGGVWLHEPGTDVAYLVGGLLPTTDGFQGGTDQVWALDLTTDTFELLDDPAPGFKAWPATAVDVEGRKGYLVEGITDGTAQFGDGFSLGDPTPSAEVWELDFETEQWQVVTTTEGPIAPRRFGTASFDPVSERILHTAGNGEDGWRSDVVAIDPATGEHTAIDVNGMHVPVPVCDASYSEVSDERLVIVGGREMGYREGDAIWAYSMIDDEWTRLEPNPDPVHGAPPPASGMGYHSTPSFTSSFMLFGGDDGENILDEAWELSVGADTATWDRIVTTTTPDPRQEASILHTCDLVYGGYGTSTFNARHQDTWSLTCGSTDCTFEERVTGGGSPPHSSKLVFTQTEILMIGGYSTGSMVVHSTDRCPTQTGTWTDVTVGLADGTGSAPPAEDDHTVTPGGIGDTRFLIHGGGFNNNTTWALQNDGSGWVWSRLRPDVSEAYPEPFDRSCHAAAWHQDETRLVVFGGSISGGTGNDVWELRFYE